MLLADCRVMKTLINGLNERETELMRLMYMVADQSPSGADRLELLFESFMDAWEAKEADERKEKKPHLRLIH
jgi:hypothetical protein